MTKLFVKCMLCCIWQHEWEAALSDQGWTSHLTSNMKGKIGHYGGCIQTTEHNGTLAYVLHKWILNSGWIWKVYSEIWYAIWKRGDKTDFLKTLKREMKTESKKQACGFFLNEEIVHIYDEFRGIRSWFITRGSKCSGYCCGRGIAESADSLIDPFSMSHAAKRHVYFACGPQTFLSQAAKSKRVSLNHQFQEIFSFFILPCWKKKVWRQMQKA